ncbi:unnamed protein product, partial [Schistocephalus solidus]|uniref:BRO1 domain-containing protein n=1 Tax=Schistocephalus solidus TaxID=70667 RepID=A0A183TCF3_SCHSO
QDALVESSFVREEVEYEEAATLYNLGSAHSIVGEREGRADDDSLKQACTQFQCAAWVFQTLRERYAQFENANDMHGDLCRFYYSLMLVSICALPEFYPSQAQECVTEKSMLDGRPPALTAKLTKFLAESYDYCWNQLNAQTLASILPEKFLRDWKRLVLVKKLVYSALTNYFLAMDAAAKMKFGPGVTWLKQADIEITEAAKVAQAASNASNSPRFSAPLLVVVNFAQNVISSSCKNAIKDNETIYHERVPPLAELEAVKGANVAKPTPFDHTDPEVIGQDIFKDLLPIETLEASSMYSEMKADFLRKILAEVEEKDVALG